MARRKKKDKDVMRKRFDAVCVYCGKRYEADKLDDMPAKCCGYALIINDNYKAMSRFYDELKEVE